MGYAATVEQYERDLANSGPANASSKNGFSEIKVDLISPLSTRLRPHLWKNKECISSQCSGIGRTGHAKNCFIIDADEINDLKRHLETSEKMNSILKSSAIL